MDEETRRSRASAVLQALIDSAMFAEPGSAIDPAVMPPAEELRPLAEAFCAMLDAYNRFPVFIGVDLGTDPNRTLPQDAYDNLCQHSGGHEFEPGIIDGIETEICWKCQTKKDTRR